MEHFISASCGGEKCSICKSAASHKVEEDIPHDEPQISRYRHPYTAYVCCKCFRLIMGITVQCGF